MKNDQIGKNIGASLSIIGLFLLLVTSWFTDVYDYKLPLILITIGVIVFSFFRFIKSPVEVENSGIWFSTWTNRGWGAWLLALMLTIFYVALYFFPASLGLGSEETPNTGVIGLFDPLSMVIKGSPASEWFVYGVLYTMAVLVFGIRFIWKYRDNRYQQIRTVSVILFQLGFAFLIPEVMEGLHPELQQKWFDKDLKNMWPLDYDFFFDWHWNNMLANGKLGLYFLIFGLIMMIIISPVLTYLYGKRWYCSWVCGCGGLAETAGDPFRHLSDKSTKSWKIERWMIHIILTIVVIMTIAVIYSQLGSDPDKYWITKTHFVILTIVLLLSAVAIILFKLNLKRKEKNIAITILSVMIVLIIINHVLGSEQAFFIHSGTLRHIYGFYIGAIFSGVIGVGFYPLLGSRVWCRYGCPMAAILGIQQRIFSRFRITTNGGQCISCGHCSTYCEMGIDVRSYAQRGEDIIRASCVGCGLCSAVCPRGVLRLENGSLDIDMRMMD